MLENHVVSKPESIFINGGLNDDLSILRIADF